MKMTVSNKESDCTTQSELWGELEATPGEVRHPIGLYVSKPLPIKSPCDGASHEFI